LLAPTVNRRTHALHTSLQCAASIGAISLQRSQRTASDRPPLPR